MCRANLVLGDWGENRSNIDPDNRVNQSHQQLIILAEVLVNIPFQSYNDIPHNPNYSRVHSPIHDISSLITSFALSFLQKERTNIHI